MEITRVTADMIATHLGPDDALAMNNALNEICNGIHVDDQDFQTRIGVDREQARAVLHAMSDAISAMKEQRQAEGKEW